MDLHRQGATGSLKVDGPSYQKALYFRSGRILFGSSNDPRDQLGAILIESGRITLEQLEEVNAKVGSGNPLAKVLADSGFVSQRELGEAARSKVERILSDVIAYDSGSFEFEDGVLPKGAVDLKLSTERLVLAAVHRIPDRAFVLRHLGSLEAVLSHTTALAGASGEIQPDAGGLPDAIDGRTTLKDAAARLRLDEFEAAKIACALLFLGLLRVGGAAALVDTQPDSELDLASTARMALDTRPATPQQQPATVIMEGPIVRDTPVAPPAAAPSEVGFAFAESPPPLPAADSEPIVIDADPPPITEAPTLIMPESPIPAPAAAPPPPPAASVTPRVTPRAATKPLSHPPGALPLIHPVPPPKPEPAAAPPKPSRPSKDDLAALDELLNTRSVEGPLTPLEKPAPAWEPRFTQSAGPRGAKRSASGLRLPLLAAGLVALLGGAFIAWRFIGATTPGQAAVRPPGTTARATPAPQTQPTPDATALSASTTAPSAAPLPPDVTLPSADASTPPAPIAPPSAPTARATPAPAPPAGGGLADARALLRQGRLSDAAHGFVQHLRKAGPGTFSIQMLVACSDETVEKALANVPEPDLYILPVNYKGRPCYRVCWGLYDDEARALSATRSLPDYFRTSGSSPRVVPTSGLLP